MADDEDATEWEFSHPRHAARPGLSDRKFLGSLLFLSRFFFCFFWPPYHVSWPRGAPPAWLKDESTLWLMQPARRIPSTEFCRATPVCYRFRHAHLRSSCSRSSCSSARTEKKTTSVGDRDFAIVFFASHGRRGCRRRPLGGAGVAPSGGIGWRPAWPRLRSVAIWRPWRATPAVHLCVGRPSAFSVAVVGVRVRLSSIRSFFLLHSPPPFPLSSSPPPPPPLLLLNQNLLFPILLNHCPLPLHILLSASPSLPELPSTTQPPLHHPASPPPPGLRPPSKPQSRVKTPSLNLYLKGVLRASTHTDLFTVYIVARIHVREDKHVHMRQFYKSYAVMSFRVDG